MNTVFTAKGEYHMPVFKNAEEFYAAVGELMDRAKTDPKIGPAIAKAGFIIQFRYTDPDAMTTINALDRPTQQGAYVDVIHGPTDLKPMITMSMKADVSHAFWQGKIDLMSAVTKKQISVEGPLLKVVKLVPAVAPLFKVYPALLKEKGLTHLVGK
jgi:putative sterol carrier protein